MHSTPFRKEYILESRSGRPAATRLPGVAGTVKGMEALPSDDSIGLLISISIEKSSGRLNSPASVYILTITMRFWI